jgi:hypothetical protein
MNTFDTAERRGVLNAPAISGSGESGAGNSLLQAPALAVAVGFQTLADRPETARGFGETCHPLADG